MFETFYVTNRGKTLEARTHAGDSITFTRMQIGKGVLQDGQSIEALTALINPVKYTPISSARSTGSKAVVTGAISNVDVQTAFYFREIGLFATDPIDGEILYAYAYAGDNPDSIPAYSTAAVDFTFGFNIAFSNTSDVTVIADSSMAFVTHTDLNAALADITPEDIGAAPEAHNHSASDINSGTLDMGQAGASSAARSVQWTTADGTVFQIRPYNNLMQIVRIPSGGIASSALGFYSDGTISIDNSANWRTALSLYSKAEVDAMFQPKLYSVRGNIIRSASTGTAVGYGKATVIVLGRTVQIDFEAQIVTAGTSSSIGDIGIQIANLRSINSTIPAFTTINGGNIHFYKSDGTLDTSHEGYAGEAAMSTDNSRWNFARLYNTSGQIGTWMDNTYTTGMRITGTLWGQFT